MNVVDTLVVTLGLDTSGLKQGAKDATATTTKLTTDLVSQADRGEKAQTGALANAARAWNALIGTQRKAADAAVVTGKTMVGATERVADSGEKAIRTFGALFLLLAGGSSLKSFISSMVSLDATVGRVAHNTGSTTDVISGLGRAAERVGGTFNGAVGGVRGFVDAFQQLRTTGQSGIMEPLARLQSLGGKPIELGKDWHKSLMQIADDLHTLDKRDPALADYLGRQILGDEGLVNLAKQGSAAMREAERSAPKITQAQAEAAQKLQAELAGVHQGFQDIGNSILMDFGPAMISGLKWVKNLVDANRGLIETKVSAWVKDVGQWFEAHKGDVQAFGAAVGQLATAAGALATAFMSQSPMMMGLEAFAVMMGGRVLSAIGLVSGAMTALAAIPAPAWLLAATGLSAVGTYQSAERTAQDFSDPKSNDDPTIGVNPDTGLTYHVDKPSGNAPKIDTGNGVWAWVKSLYGFGPRGDQADKVPDTPATPAGQSEDGNALRRGEDASTRQGGLWASLKRLVGLGDDPRIREDIRDTEKNTRELRDLVKNGASLTGAAPGFGGVSASSGGIGGSGRHADGTSSPGASPSDRRYQGRGHYGEKGWWTPERQSHAVDVLMKDAGLTENGAKALVSRWKNVESAGGPTAINPKSGAAGIAQGLGSRRAGYTGTFDEQLKNAARELNGSEARAKRMLNTPGMEATGASQFERAEGYNARTGRDNFTDRTQAGMGSIAHSSDASHRYAAGGAKPTEPTVTVNDTPSHSSAPIGDQAALDAQRRIISGKGRAGDHELIEQHRQQENTPTSTGATKPSPTYSKEQYDAAKRVAEVAKHVDMNKATADQRRAVDIAGPIIAAYEKTHPQKAGGSTATHVARGKPLPSWMTPGANGPIRTVDYRDPKYAPHPLDPARQKLADAMRAPPTLTVGHTLRHALKVVSDARKLTQHDGQPVSVEMTDRSATKLGERTFGAYVGWGKRHTDQLDQSRAILHRQAASYGRMMHVAALGNVSHHATTHNVDRSVTSDTTVNGGIHVHTAATDARGIASDIEPHLRRGQAAARADYGLA